MEAMIFDIQKFCMHDGPGIRTTVFFKGCPLHCQWCANPESINEYPELQFFAGKCIGCGKCLQYCTNKAITQEAGRLFFDRNKCSNCGKCVQVCNMGARRMVGKHQEVDEVISILDKDLLFYVNSGGGITFSGGEPLRASGFILEVAKNFKAKGISIAIETCGFVPWCNFEEVIDYIDLYLIDLKFMSDKKHLKYCGVGNKQILENIRKISQTKQTIIRIPIIPGVNDDESNLKRSAQFIMGLSKNVQCVHLLPYHNLAVNKYDNLGRRYKLHMVSPPSNARMEAIKHLFEEYNLIVQIGG